MFAWGKWGGEMDRVAENYNKFIDKLQKIGQRLQESEKKFRGIFENSMEGIYQTTKGGKFITINPSLARMFGYESAEIMMEKVTDIGIQLYKDPKDRSKLLKILDKNDFIHEYQVEFYRKDKSTLWCSVSAKAYKNTENEIQYIDGFLTDITKRKKSEEALKQSHLELENRVAERTQELSNWIMELERRNTESALLRKMSEMIQVCNTDSEIYRVVQPYIQKLFPNTSGRLFEYDKKFNHLIPVITWGDSDGRDIEFVPDECWALRQGKPYFNPKQDNHLSCSHLLDTKDSDSLCVPMIICGDIIGLFYILKKEKLSEHDGFEERRELDQKQELAMTIAEHIAMALANIRLRESLKQQSIIDPLTGLHNRRFLDENMKRESFRMIRHNYTVGIIMIDVDHFKNFNDEYGHECGDSVLKALGRFLQNNTRGEDIICRYGGEEFVMILINTTLEGMQKKADDIHGKVRDALIVKCKDQSHKITISLGAALCPIHGKTLNNTLKAADEALYMAKHKGRDRVCMAEMN